MSQETQDIVFSKLLNALLNQHASDRKKMAALLKENQKLKEALCKLEMRQSEKVEVGSQPQPLSGLTAQKINDLIKEIDYCLTYFQEN